MSPVVRRRRRPRGWRRPVQWLRERRSHRVVVGLLAAAVLFVAWTAWTAWSAARDLKAVEGDALVLRAALEEGDADGAARALDDYQESARSARGATDGPTWWLVEQVPFVGDDAEAVATAADVLADLGDDGLPQLVDAAELVAARSFNPADHTFPLETIAAVIGPAQESEAAFDEAATALAAVDDTRLVGSVGTRFRQLRDIVLTARSTLGSAYRAAELMPSLLGAEGPRDHLLVLENNAELRTLGGLAGSVSRVHAEDGEVRIVEQEGTSQYGGLERPVVALTPGERDVFGATLGQWFMNASMSPDVPRAALLASTRWERELGGEIDGVFFVDPVAVSYLLTATGPVDVPGYGPVSAEDVVAKVENEVYLSTADVKVQEEYQNAVADAVFDAFAAGRGDPVEVIRALATAVAEGRVRMHSFVEEEQEQIAGTEIAGEVLDVDEDEAHLGIYVNDALESKMTYYLEYDADVVARSCSGYQQEIAGTFRLTSTVPPDVALPPSVTGHFEGARYFDEVEPGQQRLAIYLMAPSGGTFEELSLQGRSFEPVATADYHGREVAQIVTVIDAGESQRIDFELRTGRGQTGPIELDVTPGAFPGTSAGVLRSAC